MSSKSQIQNTILFEDNHLIAINKQPGQLVQGDKTGDDPLSELVKEYIKIAYSKPGKVYLGVIHRLDRPTSGVVVFAKTSKALTRMNLLFSEKKTQKTYWAVVKNKPPEDQQLLTHYLVRNPKQNKSYAYKKTVPNSKEAILSYKIAVSLQRYFMLEVELMTGRHHQIRSQLSHIGCPIKGDLKYGFDRSNSDGSIHLHARNLTFVHPVTQQLISIDAAPPKDPIWDACLSV